MNVQQSLLCKAMLFDFVTDFHSYMLNVYNFQDESNDTSFVEIASIIHVITFSVRHLESSVTSQSPALRPKTSH